MSEHEISRDEHQFRIAVIRQLTELNSSTSAVVSRLDTLNGSVAKHEARIGTLEMEASNAEAVEKAKSESWEKWEQWIRPVVFAIACALLFAILMNGPAIVKAFK